MVQVKGTLLRSVFLTMMGGSLIGMTLLASCTNSNDSAAKDRPGADSGMAKQPTTADRIARGSYLVTIAGCNDCHSPKILTPQGPVIDSSKLLSGAPAAGKIPPLDQRAFKPGYWVLMSPDLTSAAGPWGVSFASNLTPDSATGIGAWTEQTFIATLRTGKHLGAAGGRPILPPMPWNSIAKMTDEDLSALYTYLKAIPAVRNQVPAAQPPIAQGK